MSNSNSWLEIPQSSDFTIYNLPYGIFSTNQNGKRAGVAIGNQIVDLAAAQAAGLFNDLNLPAGVFETGQLNDFISLGNGTWSALRARLTTLLSDENAGLKAVADSVLVNQADATMHLPVQIGDYTDFYSSMEHATNVGIMFRGKDNALMPNWKHIPVGYHGRSSSIIPSGTPFHRPKGQMLPAGAETPVFGPSKLLDIELEMGFIVGKSTELGDTVSVDNAKDHIFGMVLFNDWSARDIQKWEYVPLGPFLGKNFASSISPWIVPMQALEPYRVASPKQDPQVLPYLQHEGNNSYDIHLEVYLRPDGGEDQLISKSNHKYLYWTIFQQLAHHTVNGCNINVGDMYASGTISGPTKDSFGSLLELTWRGENPIQLKDGSERKFLQDFDWITIKGYCQKDGQRIGFGEVTTQILPVKD
ncbi:MAG: fumarylacetoacetase [Bacteroidetes bacterium]|nr:fumarylacetoacetase [Bacteroidota bacterium]